MSAHGLICLRSGSPLQATHPLPLSSPFVPTRTQRITKAINRNVEMVSSARALKAGDTFSVKDIKVCKACSMHGTRRPGVMHLVGVGSLD